MTTHINTEIQDLINQITTVNIPQIDIDTNQVKKILHLAESIVEKRPLNITHYTKVLVPLIVSKEKCIHENCTRKAEYINCHEKTEKYCWIHSQSF